MNKPIKKIGVIVRPQSPELAESCKDMFACFLHFGIEIMLEENSAKMLNLESKGLNFSEILNKADALLSIGGDGTLISAVRKSVGSKIPVFGINLGRLGFLTAIKPSELQDFIPMLLKGEYKLDSHRLLKAKLESSKDEFFALNECFISKKQNGMIKIHAHINGKYFNTYRADGLIIATPTGSSAYNISAGGSVVYPHCQVILLTPVCAHSLTQRPMVVSDDLSLEFSTEDDGVILIDGQEHIEFKKGDMLNVCQNQEVSLIQNPNRDYFMILKEKFNWGGVD